MTGMDMRMNDMGSGRGSFSSRSEEKDKEHLNRRDRDRKRLAQCRAPGCCFLDSGCRIASGISPSELPRLLGPSGGIDQSRCAILDILLDRYTRHPPLHGDEGANRENALTELYFLLDKIAAAKHNGTVNIGYLLRAIPHVRTDRQRNVQGRPRCGLCTSYGWVSRRCLHRGSPHARPLAPDAEPQRLDPPCGDFKSVRFGANLAPPSVVDGMELSPAERVMRALEVLKKSDPRLAAILIEHHLEGQSVREICRKTGCNRRRLSRELKRAEEQLGYILEDMA